MKSEDTKKLLISCAVKVFFEYGFEKASMRQIVEMAGVTKPTIYYYFKNKAELYRYILDTHIQKVINSVNRIINNPGDYTEAFQSLIDSFSEGFESEPQEYAITQSEMSGRGIFYGYVRDRYFMNLFNDLADFLRIGIEKKVIRPTVEPVHGAHSLVATIIFYYNHKVLINDVLAINKSPRWSRQDLITHIFDLYTVSPKRPVHK